MNSALDGKVAIVTGASKGIGREIALALAQSGAVVVLASRDGAQLDEVSRIVTADGGNAMPVPTDVSDQCAVHALIDTTLAQFGKIDILINNAGTNYISSLVLSNDERWRAMFATNVFAVYYCTKAVLPTMIRAKSGRIINIASIAGVVGAAHNSAYSATKAAVIGFTKSVALEVARLGITVNAICPWHVDTAMMREAMAARAAMFGNNGQEYLKKVVAHHPQRRLIKPKEVAALALFLSSEDAAGITGQALNQCGGVVTA
ncbi:MAG TPA: SDR family NAD(P)-dependent oxidoreductase [Candidatus Angelobacter sp.]|jgi:NAD(P)-dependent dehydrogenase (short-subunit alcohol dehydrogenase family)